MSKVDSDLSELINNLYLQDNDKFVLNKDIFFDDTKKNLVRFKDKITELLFFTKPIYSKLVRLISERSFLSNNNPYDLIGLEQEVGFVNEVSKSKLFDMTANYAINKGLVDTRAGLLGRLTDMWFSAFRTSDRSTKIYTGFGHVFLGEDTGGTIGGSHNWIRLQILCGFGMAEFQNVHYSKERPLLVGVQLQGKGNYEYYHKKDGFLIGVSPAFDLLFRSILYLSYGAGTYTITIDNVDYNIQIWTVHNDLRFRTAYILS